MPEIFHTSLPTDRPDEELRLALVSSPKGQLVHLEVFNRESTSPSEAAILRSPVSSPRSITLPLALWPRFYEAACCLGGFMNPLPAPAYQTRACCSYTCPATPETVVLGEPGQEQLRLSLQDRRGSTFLEIKAVRSDSVETDSGEAVTIRIGPTLWSAFLGALDKLNQIMAGL
jgi:hypothetical protein